MKQRINKKYTHANKINVCYNEAGTGEMPVVFIHDFPFNRTIWSAQLNFFKADHRVISYDIRGFGGSTDESGEVSIKLLADDLIAFLDVLQIEKAIVCGLSMGGNIAVNAAILFPERFKALILCSTPCVADSITEREKRYKVIQHIENGGLQLYAETFSKTVFHPNTLLEKSELVEEVKNIILAAEKRNVISGLMALARREERISAIASLTIPTLLLSGREYQVIPLAQLELMQRTLKNSTLRIIENAGHLANMEQSEFFNQVLAEFINGLETAHSLPVENTENERKSKIHGA